MSTPHQVRVPAALLLDRRLVASAKLLWVAGRALGSLAPARLQALAGVSRPTVLRGLAQLRAAGWLPAPAAPDGGVAVPVDLLRAKGLLPQAKVLWACLRLVPGGQFTYATLAVRTGLCHNTVKRAARALQAAGWLSLSQRNKCNPIGFALCNPVHAARLAEKQEAEWRKRGRRLRGETLMREFLSLLVDSEDYQDNAAPGFLVNPGTGAKMQFDRFYFSGVAFEFQGAQRFGPTERFPSVAAFRRQLARDRVKRAICTARGIRLIEVTHADLSLAAMHRKVEGVLPLRRLEEHWPLAAYLERLAWGYRQKAERGEQATA